MSRKFKPGDIVVSKITGEKDIVKSVPGMKEYDKRSFIGASSGFVLKKNSWKPQIDWKLVSSPTKLTGFSVHISSGTKKQVSKKKIVKKKSAPTKKIDSWEDLKDGDVVKCFGDDVEDHFTLTGVFRGQSETQSHCFVLELEKKSDKYGVGGGQNNWWNFRKDRVDFLRLVKSEKVVPKKTKIDLSHMEKLVIDDTIKSEIVSTLKQTENHGTIFDKWGLGDVIEYGKGMTFMFYGLPGTGKTWAATLMAKTLGRELLMMSPADIQSSEPGAANRNIEQAFKTAKEKNKVLFIDECDSLIFNREHLGMVLSGEVNTLLTCIEKFEGVCILATNRIDEMDKALERRISLIVEFPMPTEAQRAEIWKKLLPKKLPTKDVEIVELARHPISGGLIKNCVLAAARLAAAEGSKHVTKAHFDTAIARTTKSTGIMGKRRAQARAMNDYSSSPGVSVGVERGVDKRPSVDRSIDEWIEEK